MGNNEEEAFLPLYEKIWLKYRVSRVMDSLTMGLLVLLLLYRVFSYEHYSFSYLLAFLCESCFAFFFIIIISTKWNPSHTITYPHRLFSRVPELPSVDLFVTTADPILEPPIITVNTVLSLLALDYPPNKLACYVSDDGCSPLTLYALVEASKFAQIWVPFCKKYNVQVRAPFRYFSHGAMPNNNAHHFPEFKQEWLTMKDEYDNLSRKIQNATQKSIMLDHEFAIFSTAQKNNHPTIIKVIWENKESDSDGVPHLIYVSREKRPQHHHNYKAGAMNVLTRVSGVMTNAPFILNVDCDMHVNNPQIVQHSLCILLDPKGEKEVAFAQCPQQFYDGLKDDPFGDQLVAIFVYIGAGVSGIQGIFYVGTNCMHRRKVIYGLDPPQDDGNLQNGSKDLAFTNGKLSEKDQVFGSSKELVKAAAKVLEGNLFTSNAKSLCKSIEVAKEVASCTYENGTGWGEKVGWMYGSIAEDMLTGLKIHTKGWKSEVCSPVEMAFMGCSPQDSIVHMTQFKRWGTSLLEILFSKHSPIFGTMFGKLQFRQYLAYLWILTWALRSLPEISYAALTAYCLITNSSFLPKGLGLFIPLALAVNYQICTLIECLKTGLSFKTWWNTHRMGRITTMNSWFLAFLAIIPKLLGISETVFVVTKKEQHSSSEVADENNGRFTFNSSSVFVPGTTILLVQLTALVIYLFGLQPSVNRSGQGCGVGEVLCSAYLVVCYLPFLKGLFGKGKYGIPFSTICKSSVLAFIFVHFCRSTITY